MREYGQIQCSFWSDPDVQGLSDQAKLLASYLLTGPHSNGLGCYRLPSGYLQADLGWSSETVSKRFQELFDMGFCKQCETTDFVVIHKFLHWNPIANQNVAKARQREFESVPKKSGVIRHLASELLQYGNHWENGFETLLKGYAKQEPEPDPTQNQPEPRNAPSDDSLSAGSDQNKTIVELIPLKDGSEHPVTAAEVAEYQRLFPAIDVHQSLRNARAWAVANPAKRKTPRGVAAFITSWLTRDQKDADKPPHSSLGQPRFSRPAQTANTHGGFDARRYTSHIPEWAKELSESEES